VATSRAMDVLGHSLPPVTSPEYHTPATLAATTAGFNAAFRWSAGITFVALFAALLLRGAVAVRQPSPKVEVAPAD